MYVHIHLLQDANGVLADRLILQGDLVMGEEELVMCIALIQR